MVNIKELEKEKLEKINGGFSLWSMIGLTSVAVFVIGVIDGFVRPLSCNS